MRLLARVGRLEKARTKLPTGATDMTELLVALGAEVPPGKPALFHPREIAEAMSRLAEGDHQPSTPVLPYP